MLIELYKLSSNTLVKQVVGFENVFRWVDFTVLFQVEDHGQDEQLVSISV